MSPYALLVVGILGIVALVGVSAYIGYQREGDGTPIDAEAEDS